LSSNAFCNCRALSRVTFGPGSQLSSIESSAFEKCSALRSISIPSSVETIPQKCFSACSSLSMVPRSQMSLIKSCAFLNCSSLRSICILSSVEMIHENFSLKSVSSDARHFRQSHSNLGRDCCALKVPHFRCHSFRRFAFLLLSKCFAESASVVVDRFQS
jgi:hypothetical protein